MSHPSLTLDEIRSVFPGYDWQAGIRKESNSSGFKFYLVTYSVPGGPAEGDEFVVCHVLRVFGSEEAALQHHSECLESNAERFLVELPDPLRTSHQLMEEVQIPAAETVGMEPHLFACYLFTVDRFFHKVFLSRRGAAVPELVAGAHALSDKLNIRKDGIVVQRIPVPQVTSVTLCGTLINLTYSGTGGVHSGLIKFRTQEEALQLVRSAGLPCNLVPAKTKRPLAPLSSQHAEASQMTPSSQVSSQAPSALSPSPSPPMSQPFVIPEPSFTQIGWRGEMTLPPLCPTPKPPAVSPIRPPTPQLLSIPRELSPEISFSPFFRQQSPPGELIGFTSQLTHPPLPASHGELSEKGERTVSDPTRREKPRISLIATHPLASLTTGGSALAAERQPPPSAPVPSCAPSAHPPVASPPKAEHCVQIDIPDPHSSPPPAPASLTEESPNDDAFIRAKIQQFLRDPSFAEYVNRVERIWLEIQKETH
ncbi:hypothetical protein PAPYR_6445 [Paratrimastix pyriformis]|uniref:Uncharacterized protein n=1 Tax=Paratrimastix pyriformis TaxID=342808 RepID=A0ABQ8UIA3_9EUKA|nr:hypothetical protein PAPYR_6445 [Paratrimastix pyriformis]